MKKSILIFSLILISLLSCSDSDEDPYSDSACDQITKVDDSRYKNNEPEGYVIRNTKITGNCLEVEILSGGCSGETWEVELIDADAIAESYPEQRYLKLLLYNEELCNAMVSKTYTFDLRPIRTTNDAVLLNLELWEEQVRYEY